MQSAIGFRKPPTEPITMHKEIIQKIKPELDKVLSFFEKEALKVRTGRASPSLVEDIQVECFGSIYPLKQLAAISIPEPRQILIQPWDKSYVESIEKALSKSGVGSSPIVDKDVIRIVLPSLSDEYRKDLLRLLAAKHEECRKTLRHWREMAWDEIQEKTKEGKIREDDKFRAKEELQKMIEDYQSRLDKVQENKQKDVEEK